MINFSDQKKIKFRSEFLVLLVSVCSRWLTHNWLWTSRIRAKSVFSYISSDIFENTLLALIREVHSSKELPTQFSKELSQKQNIVG